MTLPAAPGISDLQGGQSDLELASADCAVLLRPLNASTPILTNLEAATGGLDRDKINRAAGFIPVGNWTKKDGVKLTNDPTVNEIESHGKGSPTAFIPSKAAKSITYVPQELSLLNLRNSWGFSDDMVSAPSNTGGFTIGIPDLPRTLRYQLVLLSWTSYNGLDIFKYWIANKSEVGKRRDVDLVDSNVIEHGVTLNALNHPALPGLPFIFGACGAGLQELAASVADGSLYLPTKSVSVAPATATVTVAAGATHTKQLTVTDSNGIDRTATATWTSVDLTKATVANGLVTGVSAGSTKVTATYGTFSASCDVTVTV